MLPLLSEMLTPNAVREHGMVAAVHRSLGNVCGIILSIQFVAPLKSLAVITKCHVLAEFPPENYVKWT